MKPLGHTFKTKDISQKFPHQTHFPKSLASMSYLLMVKPITGKWNEVTSIGLDKLKFTSGSEAEPLS